MNRSLYLFAFSGLMLFSLLFTSCGGKKEETAEATTENTQTESTEKPAPNPDNETAIMH